MKNLLSLLVCLGMLAFVTGCASPSSVQQSTDSATSEELSVQDSSASSANTVDNPSQSISSGFEQNSISSTNIPEALKESETYNVTATFHFSGSGDNPNKQINIICPQKWTAEIGKICIDDNKILDLICYDKAKLSQSELISLEKKTINEFDFYTKTEDTMIFEKPKHISFSLWYYYFFDEQYTYLIRFFHNNETNTITQLQFEEILSTISFN